jgi:predicted outer membrane protein
MAEAWLPALNPLVRKKSIRISLNLRVTTSVFPVPNCRQKEEPMPDHRGMTGRAKARTALVVVATLAVVGVGSVMVLNASAQTAPGSTQAQVPAHTMPGMQMGSAAQAAATNDVAGAGPVTELDKTFLVKVRQAGLWEIPAGDLAQTHASSEAVKRAGLHLLDGHSHLDQLVREDAKILGVTLPDQATAEQQGWVRQLTDAQGLEFDKLFANLLRASHGKIFATIAEVRAGSQNDVIRRHATQANQTVLDHMTVLEDTGLVDAKTIADVAAAVNPPAK